MPKNEVETVLAHEVCHEVNGDMITMTLVQGAVNNFVVFLSRIIVHVFNRVLFRVGRATDPHFGLFLL
jgi:heat shock protein HtpX